MKNAVLVIAVLATAALTGCTGQADAPSSAPQSSASSTRATEPATPTPAPSVDPEQVKADAIANGRPEAAFDKHCQVWEAPRASTKQQKWANELGQAWLDAEDAACPDAIIAPSYYVESWKPGRDGELVLIVDSAINKQMWGTEDVGVLKDLALDAFNKISDDHPDLKMVTGTTENGYRTVSVDLGDLEKARADDAVVY